ncbi:MAG: hypothetical protein GY909_07350 [Oligoflexia bacterium]|nr:hypothetical protein [Oligoflexia bacterium]
MLGKHFLLKAAITFSLLTSVYAQKEKDDLAYLENDFVIETGVSFTQTENEEATTAMQMGLYRRGLVIKNIDDKKVKRILEIALQVDINSNAELQKLDIEIIPLAIDRKSENGGPLTWNDPNSHKDTMIFFPIEISKDLAMKIEREIAVYAYGWQAGGNFQINKGAPKAQWIYAEIDARFAGYKDLKISSFDDEYLGGFSLYNVEARLGYGMQLTDKISMRFILGGSFSTHWYRKVFNMVENATKGIKETHAFARVEIGNDRNVLSIEGHYQHIDSYASDDNLYTHVEDDSINEHDFSLWLKYKRKF